MNEPETQNSSLPATVPDTTIVPTPVPEIEYRQPATPGELRASQVDQALAPAYARASTLELTEAERSGLTAPFSDDAVEIRPHDGLIYIPHITISRRLIEVFGPAKWAMVRRREWCDGGMIYAEWIMLIRGCYIGESVGAMQYHPTNPKMNYSDALEGTRGEAIRRIAAKDLGCGDQCWEPAYARHWVSQYAVQVRGRWERRRAAVDPLPDPKPTPCSPPVRPQATDKPEEDQKDKKARWISACLEAGGGRADYAEVFFKDQGVLLEFETLADFPIDRIPATRKMANVILDQIRMRSGVGDPPDLAPVDPGAEQSTGQILNPPNSDEKHTVTGMLKWMGDKPTSKGVKYSLLIVQDLADKAGGEWVTTFSDTDAGVAKALLSKKVTCTCTRNQYGFLLTERGIQGAV
jgi:hypothetical protein